MGKVYDKKLEKHISGRKREKRELAKKNTEGPDHQSKTSWGR